METRNSVQYTGVFFRSPKKNLDRVHLHEYYEINVKLMAFADINTGLSVSYRPHNPYLNPDRCIHNIPVVVHNK